MLRKLSILFLLFLVACSFSRKRDELTIIDLKLFAMSFEPTLQMTTIDNEARVVFKDDLELYITYKTRYNLENIKDRNGNIVDEKVKSIDTVYTAFIRKKGQSKGMSYPWGKSSSNVGTVINADSVWSTFAFYAKDLERFNGDIGKPLEVSKKGGELIEKYYVTTVPGGVDSIYRFFDKAMKHVPYSFSKRYDSLYNSKLYKIQFVINEIPKGVLLPNVTIPRREYYHEMKLVSEKNIQKYVDLLRKFEEDSRRLNLN